MNRNAFARIAAAAIACASLGTPAFAQYTERAWDNLTLSKTYLKTLDTMLPLDVSANTPAFSPTIVTCSGRRTCVLRIEFSAGANLLKELASGWDLAAYTVVRVDGQPQFSDDPDVVFPRHEVLLGYDSAGPSTFSFVTEVEPGEHTVEIFVKPQYGGTDIFVKSRSLTIEVYRVP